MSVRVAAILSELLFGVFNDVVSDSSDKGVDVGVGVDRMGA